MTERLLHAVAVPSDSQTDTGSRQQKRLAKQGALQSDVPYADAISPQPGQQTLVGQVRGKFAPIHAQMIDELLSSSIPVVPYAGREGQDTIDGYYAPETTQQSRLDPREERVQQFDGVLAPKGTRRSHWRAVRTNPQSDDNPFDAGAAPELGLSIRARKVRWFDDVDGGLEDATAQRTVEGEHDHIDIYDPEEPSFGKPLLIYDIPYTEEYPTDCVVWDTYDREKVYREPGDGATVGSATVGSATVGGDDVRVASQWQRVYLTDHEYRGDMVLETDRLRLVIDQPEDVLRAYRWDPADGQYALLQLGASDWRLFDVDVTSIGLVRLKAQFEFEDMSTGDRVNLNGTLIRGLDNVVWTEPVNEGATPQGLQDRLAPIASETGSIIEPSGDVIKRTEVDR
ncbi:hypothetical protein NDI56_03935 [Haloarcula sp. S1CR25-12]|uniref:Uncharacterized protein n=1 Tax=Haloarcula saliterrae TaxID=2950534 RepID=A0ABU2FA20_9EURY|nr:hypothetical protein [Haloarcula sp. S1CR25-12]MDS0258561.1 hypothetical protein [Haloarcula sp. S1CR25-12]